MPRRVSRLHFLFCYFITKWRTVALFAGLVPLLVVVSFYLTREKIVLWQGEAVAQEGEVVRFASYSKGSGGVTPVVVVRTKDGQELQLITSVRSTLHCRTGDKILLRKKGRGFFVDPRGCISLASNGRGT